MNNGEALHKAVENIEKEITYWIQYVAQDHDQDHSNGGIARDLVALIILHKELQGWLPHDDPFKSWRDAIPSERAS